MKKKLFSLAAVVMSASLLLSACGESSPAPATQTPVASEAPSGAEASSEPQQEPEAEASAEPKIFHTATVARTTANPHMYTNSRYMRFLGTLVAELSTVDGTDKLEFVPHHAETLPYSEDGLVWTVEIRKDLQWANDGSPLDANHYYYSMQQVLDPLLVNKNAPYLFDPCVVVNAKEYYAGNCDWEDVGIKLIDDYTLEITLQYQVTPLDFWTTIGQVIWPVHIEMYEALMNEERTTTTYGTSLETTPSCGTWIMTEWVIDGHETFAINKNDPLVKMGYFFLDGWNERAISQQATRVELFHKGELDSISITGDDYTKYKNDPRSRPLYAPNIWGWFLNGESENTIMQSQDFRKALILSCPRVAIAKDVFLAYDPSNYIISTAIMVGDPLVSTTYFRDTPMAKANAAEFADNDELALELFNKAWEANGSKKVTIEVTYFDGQEDMKRTAEVSQEKWEQLFGSDRIEFELRAVVPASAYDNYRIGDYDIGIGVRLVNIYNPWSSMSVWTQDYQGKYLTGFASDEFDELYRESMYGEWVTDEEKRAEALAKMEYLLMDYGVFSPIMQNNNTVMYQDWIYLPTETHLPNIGYAPLQSDIMP